MVSDLGLLRRSLNIVKQIYDLDTVNNTVKDGKFAYPRVDQDSSAGMSFELRDVTFSYPGSRSTVNSLDHVSLTIKAGQLVVIVGSNGSGKSTIVKLLTRLYDASSGEILVDGTAIEDYRISDLRSATAILTQDHHLYPLSLAENIGLGDPEQVSNTAMILESARKGGADSFVSKMSQGFSTVLDPVTLQYAVHVRKEDKTELAKELEKLEKTIDVSGGERQRLVASRTFMRFNSGNVRFVAVDEPSSALDPEGELELFNNLLKERAGKTMVFVTHRFGHLTKYADLIICMKDGRVAESGTHEELLTLNGEYFKLYNIQAQAFETI